MRPAVSGGGSLTTSTMDDDDDLFSTEYPVSASEDEGNEDDGESVRKHQKLLEAISSLDGKKRKKLVERTEASLQVSEYAISSEGTGEKISLLDAVKPIKKATSLSTVKKQLNKLNDKKSVELPLSKEETQKIQRIVGYQSASEEVTKWDPIVKQNRRAEQLVFPLNDEALKPTPIEEVVTGWKARTPLEMEIFNILHKNKQPITDPLLTPVEKASLKAMSLQEAKLRRAELQKARALQSYYEAKARREKKIKSKNYHRQLKRGKKKEAIKEFEELRKTNPEAALEELEKLEKARMQERMSLKHQNSGKWAKSKAIMAKYDEEARKAMQEQLQRNKDLTQKVQPLSESESEKEEETVPDFVNDAQVISEGPNPWMTGKLSTEVRDSGGQEEEEGQLEGELGTKADEDKKEEEEEEEKKEEDEEEEVLLKEFEEKRLWRKEQEQDSLATETGNKPDPSAAMEQEPEEKQVSHFNILFQKLVEQNRKEEEQNEDTAKAEDKESDGDEVELQPAEEGPLLIESLDRKQILEDLEGLRQEEHCEEEHCEKPEMLKKAPAKKKPAKEKKGKKSKLIDHSDVLPAKARKVQTPLVPSIVEDEEEHAEEDAEAQKMMIQEAFAGDDVISDFLKEKRSTEEADKPKEVNLVLPGWGDWGGANLRVSKRKRRKFIIKADPAPPRKDRRLPNVIINEKRNIMAAAHQVSELPFPFNCRQRFESSIRVPVGKTWNTQKAVQKLTSPQVITKKGHIIEPITQDEFQKYTKPKKAEMELSPPEEKSSWRPSRGRKRRL